MRMDFAVGIGRNEKIYELGSHAKVAEESGFAHMTVGDVQNCTRDLYVKMAMAAINTHRIKIGSGVTLPITRHPAITATAHATVDELSGGRVFLGFGTGGTSLGFLGLKPPTLKRLREEIEFFRQYMTGDETEYNGVKMHSEWVRHTVPIYISGEGPRSLELAGELGDGVYIMGGPPELVRWKVDHIEKGALKAGRDPSKIDICSRTEIYVADTKEEALREMSGHLPRATINILEQHAEDPVIAKLTSRLDEQHPGLLDEMRRHRDVFDMYDHEKIDTPSSKYVTQHMIDQVHLVGRVDDICEGIYQLGKAGVTTIATATYTLIDKKGMMREIGDKIMPNFRN